jgi:hypothetical protein
MPLPATGGLNESAMFLLREMQCLGQELNRPPVGRAAHSTLQVTDAPGAHAYSLGQFLLCQAGSSPVRSQELAEGGKGSCCHHQRTSLEMLSYADAKMPGLRFLIVPHSSLRGRQVRG